jgi:acetyltransferase-like isoleucine patch superfamily enzyme
VKCAIAPGSDLPEDTCLGPLSSSHEVEDASPDYRNYCRTAFASPPTLLVLLIGIPILMIVNVMALIPWFICLKIMVTQAKTEGWYKSNLTTIFDAFLWWITPQRLVYYFMLRIIRRCVVPFIRLAFTILIKRTFIGKFTAMNDREKLKPWNTFRYWLMARLLSGGNLAGVTRLVGSHYEVVSMIYRLLGSKIGRRVYWPGSGLDIVEYDLLEIGDDVVFGSRSVIMTSSAVRSAQVTFEAGSMVADRCVVLPGVLLRKGSVLGSGSLAKEDFIGDVGSVWVGSKNGCAVQAAPADSTYNVKDTRTPFGRAFYQHQAPYLVIPLWAISMYNTTWQAFCTCYRNSYMALSLFLCNWLLQLDTYDDHPPLKLFMLTLIAVVPLHLTMSIMALSFDITSKWILLGRRVQGVFSWDQSSYCQRWQVYLTLQEIRRSDRHKTGLLDLIQGSQYLVWYFRCLGCDIGENVCLYPNGGDPMMTEPDLCTIGDRASIDDASLIAHINTRGVFRLNPVKVGQGCVLKSMTRLLSGATMEPHSIMLEHTLVLAGESVDMGSVWQGWPSDNQIYLETYRENMRREIDIIIRRQLSSSRTALPRPRLNSSTYYSTIAAAENDDIEMYPGRRGGSDRTRSSNGRYGRGGESENAPLLGKENRSKVKYGSGYGSS